MRPRDVHATGRTERARCDVPDGPSERPTLAPADRFGVDTGQTRNHRALLCPPSRPTSSLWSKVPFQRGPIPASPVQAPRREPTRMRHRPTRAAPETVGAPTRGRGTKRVGYGGREDARCPALGPRWCCGRRAELARLNIGYGQVAPSPGKDERCARRPSAGRERPAFVGSVRPRGGVGSRPSRMRRTRSGATAVPRFPGLRRRRGAPGASADSLPTPGGSQSHAGSHQRRCGVGAHLVRSSTTGG